MRASGFPFASRIPSKETTAITTKTGMVIAANHRKIGRAAACFGFSSTVVLHIYENKNNSTIATPSLIHAGFVQTRRTPHFLCALRFSALILSEVEESINAENRRAQRNIRARPSTTQLQPRRESYACKTRFPVGVAWVRSFMALVNSWFRRLGPWE